MGSIDEVSHAIGELQAGIQVQNNWLQGMDDKQDALKEKIDKLASKEDISSLVDRVKKLEHFKTYGLGVYAGLSALFLIAAIVAKKGLVALVAMVG